MNLTRYALALVWLGTAVASLHDGGRAGAALLPPMAPNTALAVVWLGSAWDAALGLALLLRPSALVYRLAALGVIVMTALATLLLPALWLDPFGPLLKNLPLLEMLRQLDKEART
jgi:hypothetical protein